MRRFVSVARNSINSVVLDTSIVAKSVLTLPRHLPRDICNREVIMRKKIHTLLDILGKRNVKVFFPKAGIVEAASVLRRSNLKRGLIIKIIESLNKTFIVVDENIIYDKALEVALTTAPSGFDAYFIALALFTGSILIAVIKVWHAMLRTGALRNTC